MSCQQAMDLVSQIEDEMSAWHVTQRKAAREALFWILPMIPDVPAIQQSLDAQAAQDAVKSIRPRAENLSAGDADAVTDTKNVLSATRETLFEDEPQGFGAATQNMQHWQGSSATAFKTYLNQTDTAYRVAQDALGDLATLYDLYGNIVSECHHDLISILQAGLSAFQNVDQQAISVVLTTASAVLAPLTAGDSLVLVGLAGLVGGASSLVATINVSTSSDLETAQSILTALDHLKDNTNARIKQVNDTLVELGKKTNSKTADVQHNVPTFAQPGQPFDPGSFEPDSPPPNPKPISKDPLVPGVDWPSDIGQRLNPV
ncbi:hypothetical protein Atai01_71140 [Amycolatopsis taiwanensis]|uniref:Uncharacterized protein n=3 Tax=Amycolatopsis taiwanensis TaxID=342230 RepID=A0A9W6RAP1_9PSEU|nr:hypothetical protein Atai01_71140 [Amycolatopsis taiwanensis]